VKIARNAIFNVLSFGVNLAVTFLLVPVMLRYLGTTGFGIWAVVRAFVGYASLGDLGLTSTVTKYVAEHAAHDDREAIARVLKSALVLYLAVVLVLFLLLLLLQHAIVELFFSTSGEFAGEITFVLYGSLAVFGVNMIFSIFPNALSGLQRMDLTNTVLAIYTVVNGACMYWALVAGTGLRGLVWANALATVVATVLNGILFYRSFRGLPLVKTRLKKGDVRQLFRFSKHVFAVSIAGSVHQHFDKLLLSSFVNLNVVGAYEVGARLVDQARKIPSLMLNPLLPAASEVHAQKQTEKLKSMYYRSMKFFLVLGVPLMGCAAFFAQPFVELWLGNVNSLIVPTAQILMISNFINLLTGPGFYISIGIGNERLPMYSSVLGLVLNIILSVILLKFFGYFGVVFGSFAALIIASIFFLALVHRAMTIRTASVLAMAWKPLTALAGGFAFSELIGMWNVDPLPQLVLMVAGTLLVYGTMIWLLKYFDDADRETVKTFRRLLSARISGQQDAQ